jgi:hypothetical protein
MEELNDKLKQQIERFVDDRLAAAQPQVYQNAIVSGQVKPRHMVPGENPAGTIYQSDGANFTAIPQGTDGQVLTSDGEGGFSYTTPATFSLSMRAQAITTNSTQTGITIQGGWNFVQGNGTSNMSKAITFPATFTTILVPPLITPLNGKNSAGDPTALSDFATNWGVAQNWTTVSLTTSGFTAFNFMAATLTANQYSGFTWITIGII